MKTSSKIRLGVILIYLILGAYIASVLFSVIQVSILIEDKFVGNVGYTGAIENPDVDNVTIRIYFDFYNPGIYAISADTFYAGIYIQSSENDTVLPPNTLLGEINGSFYFPARSTTNESLDLEINSQYFNALMMYTANLRFDLLINAGLAGIHFDLNANFTYFWNFTELMQQYVP